ncbi:hypothetical protein M3J09_007799 [Ascochyta lentis]
MVVVQAATADSRQRQRIALSTYPNATTARSSTSASTSTSTQGPTFSKPLPHLAPNSLPRSGHTQSTQHPSKKLNETLPPRTTPNTASVHLYTAPYPMPSTYSINLKRFDILAFIQNAWSTAPLLFPTRDS